MLTGREAAEDARAEPAFWRSTEQLDRQAEPAESVRVLLSRSVTCDDDALRRKCAERVFDGLRWIEVARLTADLALLGKRPLGFEGTHLGLTLRVVVGRREPVERSHLRGSDDMNPRRGVDPSGERSTEPNRIRVADEQEHDVLQHPEV